MKEITNKYPAVRLVGPDVGYQQALDYIWKTDMALDYPSYSGNDKEFRHVLENSTRKKLGLHYLSSHYVSTAYVTGPYGPVSPEGKVELATNFWGYPTTEKIESDFTSQKTF